MYRGTCGGQWGAFSESDAISKRGKQTVTVTLCQSYLDTRNANEPSEMSPSPSFFLPSTDHALHVLRPFLLIRFHTTNNKKLANLR
jgi:hypothetical protein